MALHSRLDWNNVSIRNRGVFLVVHPPFVEGPARSNEEALFRWGCLGKSVGYIGAKDEEILGRRDSIE